MLREIQTQIQEDYTRVEVYFQTLNVKSIIQSALYPVITSIIKGYQSKKNTCSFFHLLWAVSF